MNGKVLQLRNRLLPLLSRRWLQYFALAVAGFAVHLPALPGEFLWDDGYLARDNPFIKSPLLALEAFRHYLFLGSSSAHYRPVQNLSYMLDYYVWNTESAGFHLTSILLHVASGLLLLRLLTRLFGKEGGLWPIHPRFSIAPSVAAFSVAAIWMVHPVHSAAVDYVSGRADSLAFSFAAGGWLLFLRASEFRAWALRSLFYLLAGCCALLSLCSREIACIWLAIFLIYTLVFAEGISRRKKIGTLLCSGLVLGVYAVLRQLPESSGQVAEGTLPASVRMTLMLRALGDYAWLIVWPAHLHMERTIFNPYAFHDHSSWRQAVSTEYLSILGLFVTAAFIAGCAWRSPARRLRIAGAIWFFAGYLPVSNVVQLNATIAEHWLYLPSVGVFIFLLGCFLEIPARAYRFLPPAVAIAILALAVRSGIRSSDWRDDQTFFTRTFATGGRSGRVLVNLAQCYANRGLYAKEEEICRRILQMDPHYAAARNNLGCALSSQGRKAEAEVVFAQSSQEAPVYSKGYPHSWMAARNYAQLRFGAGDTPTAIAALEKARIDFPDTWELTSLESEILRRTKGTAAALAIVRDFAQQKWWHQAARLAEGRLYAESNDSVHAEGALRFAAMLDVHDVEALNLLARIYGRQHRLEEARATQRRAVARQPDRPTEYCMLASILEEMGRDQEADAVLAKVSSMRAMAKEQPALAMMAN